MKFYIVRHGQTIANTQKMLQGFIDTPLTNLGIQQGKRRAELCMNLTFDCAYSSSSQRAIDTCKFILEGRDIPFYTSDDFKEMNFGSKEGVIAPAYFREDAEVDYDTYFSQFGGETSKEVVDRFINGLLKIANDTTYENVLIASHGLCIRLVMYAINLERYNVLTKGKYLSNCAMCIVEYKDGKLELIDIDNTEI